eukprot:s1008_g4.t1
MAILQRLGLLEYCRTVQHECFLWHNSEMISRLQVCPLELQHGHHLRLALPPGRDELNHIGTRCLASACHQGLGAHEICERFALYQLGWYDTIIGPPLVPLRPDEDEVSLLQLTPPLDPYPWFLLTESDCKIDDCPHDRLPSDPGEITRSMIACNQQNQLPGGIELRAEVEDQPEYIQNLLDQLEEHGAIEVEEEGPVLYVVTWFLNHPHHDRCSESRALRISGTFQHWQHNFLLAWRDRLEEGVPVNFFLVFPQPPSTRFEPMVLPHLILAQHSPLQSKASVITTLTNDHKHNVALFVPDLPNKVDIILGADTIDDCYPEISSLQCMVWHGEYELRGEQRIAVHDGVSFVLIIQNVQHMTNDAWDAADDDDSLSLMQRRSDSTSSALDPDAPAFRPGCPTIYGQTEEIQEIFHLWTQQVTSSRESERSAWFSTWFVDHGRNLLDCQQPRPVRLNADFENWEATIKQAWSDRIVASELCTLHLVAPILQTWILHLLATSL